MAERRHWNITIEYLQDIVAKQTFGDSPAVALRELIQNAHDACLVSSALTNTTDYSVHIILDPSENTITIHDNGIGMTDEDIGEYLTTIGRGKKGRDIASKYKMSDRQARRLENVVGEFGFGFIAGFIVADQIELWTRPAHREGPAIHCTFSTVDEEYDSEEVIGPEQGTKLVLHVNERTQRRGMRPTEHLIDGNILSWDTVDAIVKKYCLLLEFPIYVSMAGEVPQSPSNQVEVPWSAGHSLRESVQHFYHNRSGIGNLGEILHAMPLSATRQQDSVSLEGVLFIEDAPHADDSPGNLEVFVKRMWVCERQSSLLPAWASFLQGIVVTPELRPLPGRDALDPLHDGFDRVKRELHTLIYHAFLELARTNSKVFNKMLERYGQTFRWGLREEKQRADRTKQPFQEAELVRYVRFVRYGKRFIQGNICNLNEYLGVPPIQPLEFKDRKRVIHMVPRPIQPDQQLEFRRLLGSRPVDVIVPEDQTQAGLLMSLDEIFDDLLVHSVEADLLTSYAGLLEGEQRTRWQAFLRYYAVLASTHKMAGAEVGDLQPEHMPALILNVPNVQSTNVESEDGADEANQRLVRPLPIPGLPPEIAALYGQTLVINSRNATMKQLLDYKESLGLEEVDDTLDQCLHECYHMALDAAYGSMPGDVLQHHLDFRSTIIQSYLKSQRDRFSDGNADRAMSEELTVLKDELGRYRGKYGPLEATSEPGIDVPSSPAERLGVVVFCDMVASTGSLVSMDFAHRGTVLDEFVELAREQVRRRSGFFDKFTGDGLIALFGVENERPPGRDFSADLWREACSRAWVFAMEMNAAMVGFNERAQIKRIVVDNDLDAMKLRISIDAGVVLFGHFGGLGTAIGLPVIVASRLCAEKEAFDQSGSSVLVTQRFHAQSGMKEFREVDYVFEPRGIGRMIRIFQPV